MGEMGEEEEEGEGEEEGGGGEGREGGRGSIGRWSRRSTRASSSLLGWFTCIHGSNMKMLHIKLQYRL